MNGYKQLNLMLAGHLHHVLTFMVGCVLLAFFVRTMRSWRDVVKLDSEQFKAIGEQMMRPLSERLAPQNDIAVRQLRLSLIQAGLRQENASEKYMAMRLISLGVGVGSVLMLVGMGFDATHVLLMGGLFLFASYAYPDFYLRQRIASRQAQIARALPTLVDLMVLCLDVGLSLEASFERVTFEIRSLEPLMAEEAGVMLSEMGGGITFPQALKRMGDRIGLEDLMVLARLISQASLMGASIARALREYSDQAFNKRMISLEEKAGKISSMMVLPVTLCMLPAALIALVGPAILMLVKLIAQS
jgi:tight adherence protein C